MKRFIYMLVLPIALAILLIGCSENDTHSSGEQQNQSVEEKLSVEQEESPSKNNESSTIQASINGKAIMQEELDYECFRAQLNQALTADTMEAPCPSEGTMITQIIQLRAVDYLAKEQEIIVTESEVNERVNKLKAELASSVVFQEKIQSYGEEKFWQKEQNRYYTIIKTEKIKEQLIAYEKEKYAGFAGNVYDEETYDMNSQKELEELITAAVGLLDVKINES